MVKSTNKIQRKYCLFYRCQYGNGFGFYIKIKNKKNRMYEKITTQQMVWVLQVKGQFYFKYVHNEQVDVTFNESIQL